MSTSKPALSFVAFFIVIVASAVVPVRAAAPVVTAIGQITTADEGKQVTVQGTVAETGNFSAGFKLSVRDTTGQITATVWADDWDHVYNSFHLNTGAMIRVTGKVNVYQSQLEIVPDRGADVEVVTWARRDWRKYELGRMNGNDHNAVVWVEGTVADIQPFADGTYLLLWDDTGAQRVKLYDVVARRIPQQELLWVGQRVSVVGRVRAKRRVGLEIVVALPHDVYVLGSEQPGEASGV
ncbi:MAG: OB-fold nucleic acid binding domain-containing protein [Chloroflexi bacterium]|nr:OB-fold nucleic acid binding domain-containing protein [Chloroflexota bacterium]